MRGPLHNNCTIPAGEATMAQIESSIKWYESYMATYPRLVAGREFERAPDSFYDSLARLKAERANRIGKVKP